MKTIWLACAWPDKADDFCWSVLGAYETEQEAVDACTKPTHWVGPLMLGERLPDEGVKWEGAYYPDTRKPA